MTVELRIAALAHTLLDDLETLYYNVHLTPSQYDQAVSTVLESFQQVALLAELTDPSTAYEDSPANKPLSSLIKPQRWCSKCQASFDPATACPHFAPYRQG